MNARDAILGRLRSSAREQERPSIWRSRRQFEDLAGRFEESLVKAKGEVIRTGDLSEALDRLEDVLGSLKARRVVVNGDTPIGAQELQARWPSIEWYSVGRTEGDLRDFCAHADAGISGAVAALAETGTLVVESGPTASRMATLLPPVHIALVSTGSLTTDIFSWVLARQGAMPASLTLISGPSKTADIEQMLAVGVHGPIRLIVILFEGGTFSL